MMAVRSKCDLYRSFGNVVTNISKKYFIEVAKGRPYEIVLKTKISKLFYFSALQVNIRSNHMKEEISHFNEAGFLEIAIFEVIHQSRI
jgi:S-adenosylmethionine hydrolase